MIHLDPDERIIRTVRKHWFIPAKEIAIAFLGAILPVFILGISAGIIEAYGISINHSLSILWTAYSYSIWLIVIWTRLTSTLMDHQLDAWVITSKRIIDIEQKGLWQHEVSSFRLDQIQDITIEIKGLFSTLLRFGTIHAQTAGEHRILMMHHAPNPEDIKTSIWKASETLLAKPRATFSSVPKNDPSRLKLP